MHLVTDKSSCASFSSSVLYFLGYSNEEMEGQSWYSLVHPEDLSTLAESHQNLGKYAHMLYLNVFNLYRESRGAGSPIL